MSEDTQRMNSLSLSGIKSNGMDDEYYNVDDFFASYVAELSNHSKRQVEEGTIPNAKHIKYQQPSGIPSEMPPGSLLLNSDILLPGPNQQAPVVTLPLDPASAGNAYDFQDASARSKSHKQQEANKVAQQRYRERKKQKYQEMERTVEQLQAQLNALQSLQKRNDILEGMNTDLQKALVDREREVDRLKVVLDGLSDASLGASADSGAGGGGLMDEHNDEPNIALPKWVSTTDTGVGGASDVDFNKCVPCDILPRDLSGIDFKVGFKDQMAALEAFMKEHSLEGADSRCSGVSPDVVCQLGGIVGRCCQLCQAAIRAEGVRVLELIIRDPGTLSSVDSVERARWDRALEVMQLSPEQEDQLLLLRQSHLERVRDIYTERQTLNLEAMALMLPHHSRDPAEDTTLEGRMANMSTRGYLPIAKSNAQLAEVLDRVKDNLRREQRQVMELNCCTISRILMPLQAARYMRALYPHHCDALALTNVLAHKLGREGCLGRRNESQGMLGSASAGSAPGMACEGGKGGCC